MDVEASAKRVRVLSERPRIERLHLAAGVVLDSQGDGVIGAPDDDLGAMGARMAAHVAERFSRHLEQFRAQPVAERQIRGAIDIDVDSGQLGELAGQPRDGRHERDPLVRHPLQIGDVMAQAVDFGIDHGEQTPDVGFNQAIPFFQAMENGPKAELKADVRLDHRVVYAPCDSLPLVLGRFGGQAIDEAHVVRDPQRRMHRM